MTGLRISRVRNSSSMHIRGTMTGLKDLKFEISVSCYTLHFDEISGYHRFELVAIG